MSELSFAMYIFCWKCVFINRELTVTKLIFLFFGFHGHCLFIMVAGDHFYKQVKSLPLVEQMISPLPDIETAVLDQDSEFLVLACDGIWWVEGIQYLISTLIDCSG